MYIIIKSLILFFFDFELCIEDLNFLVSVFYRLNLDILFLFLLLKDKDRVCFFNFFLKKSFFVFLRIT